MRLIVLFNQVFFSVTSIGFSNNVVERNKAKLNDDIYVTGNIGDSFVGLKIIKNNIKVNSKLKKYFINQFYCPNLPYKFIRQYINLQIHLWIYQMG